MKQAVVFNPYWDTLGGGEKYVVEVIRTLVQLGYEVEVAWMDDRLMADIARRFNLEMSTIRVNPRLYRLFTQGSWWEKWRQLHKYDLTFFMSDGSLPFLFSKRSLVHYQVPFSTLQPSVIDRIKLKTISNIIVNSRFTKKVIDRKLHVNSVVVYPPATMMPPLPKEKLILSVGRFDNLMHSKRQDVLIQTFKSLDLKGWQLVLAGGVLHGQEDVAQLRQAAGNNQDIRIVTNPAFEELAKLYGKAAIYWHAAGFGVDEAREPEKVEHFGIATVEAMSAGAVPVVFKAGGQKEVITDGVDGYFWQTIEELKTKTLKLVRSPETLRTLSQKTQETSQKFSAETFFEGLRTYAG